MEAGSRHRAQQLNRAVHGAVGGFEYTLYGIFDSPVDLGLIAEYQFDDRGSSFTPFQNDLALGGRFAFNDTQSSELLLVTGIDVDNKRPVHLNRGQSSTSARTGRAALKIQDHQQRAAWRSVCRSRR